jgi:hypothetical protein
MAKQTKIIPFNTIKVPAVISPEQINILAGAVSVAALSNREAPRAQAELHVIIAGWLRAVGLESEATEKAIEWERSFRNLFK